MNHSPFGPSPSPARRTDRKPLLGTTMRKTQLRGLGNVRGHERHGSLLFPSSGLLRHNATAGRRMSTGHVSLTVLEAAARDLGSGVWRVLLLARFLAVSTQGGRDRGARWGLFRKQALIPFVKAPPSCCTPPPRSQRMPSRGDLASTTGLGDKHSARSPASWRLCPGRGDGR